MSIDSRPVDSALRSASLRRRFVISLVLMSVIPLLYVGFLYDQYVKVSPQEGMWIFLAVCFLLVLVGTGAFIVRDVFNAVVKIAQGAKALAGGQLDKARVVVEDGAEMGDLAKSINIMIERMREDTNTLQSSQQELQVTKGKLLESYTKLEEAIEKLKHVDQMKSDFVANVAHELIHPLSTLRGSLDIVLANLAQDDPEKKKVLEISRRNMARLIRLVTDILDISRIESGKSELHLSTIQIEDMVEEILVPLQKLFKDKDLRFEKKVSETADVFEGDRDRIIQVATNLLINAVKYTQAHGAIRLEIFKENGQVRFSIVDNGPGMSEGDQKKLFDKFSRVTKEKQEGTGLGLCITKDIIELHHGSIHVESREGKGSTFSFVLPVKQPKERGG